MGQVKKLTKEWMHYCKYLITIEIMVDPSVCLDGYLYEHIPALSWLVYKKISPVIQECMLAENTKQEKKLKYQCNVHKWISSYNEIARISLEGKG